MDGGPTGICTPIAAVRRRHPAVGRWAPKRFCWCSPGELNSALHGFSVTCDRYTRTAEWLDAEAGVEPAAPTFRASSPYRYRALGNRGPHRRPPHHPPPAHTTPPPRLPPHPL